MAQFPGLRLTQQGNQMIIRSTSGRESDQLIVTKAILGDGNLTESIEGMTNLVSPKLDVSLTNMSNGENGTRVFKFEFDNKTVNTGFYWREVGVYAKNGQNGEEKLIAYSNASGLTSYIPDKNSPIPIQSLQVAIAVGDSSNVSAKIDLGVSVSRGEVESLLNAHKEDVQAHHLERYAGSATIPSGINNWNDLVAPGIYESNTTIFGWSNAPAQLKVYPYGQIQVHKTDGNVITQEFYSYGQGTPCKKACRTFYQTWSAWQYFLDWDNSITEVTKADEGINVTKGGATELLKLFTSDKTDTNTALVPTLSVVKALIGDVNVDVTSLLQSKGVRYDFSNENAWYICLGEAFGGLIIQGGIRIEQNNDLVVFPIGYTAKVLAIQITKGLGVNAPSYQKLTLTKFRLYAHDNRGYNLNWIAIGI